MDFFQNTNNWLKGELFESKWIIAFVLTTILVGICFWKMDNTPNAKALLLPLLIADGIYAAIGGNMLFFNQKRAVEIREIFQKDKTEFIQAEKQRVETFQYQYKISKAVAILCFIATMLIFWFSGFGGRLFFRRKGRYILSKNFRIYQLNKKQDYENRNSTYEIYYTIARDEQSTKAHTSAHQY